MRKPEVRSTGSDTTMEFQDILFILVATIGFFSAVKRAFGFIKWIWVMFLRPPKNLQEYGSWAIVTGSTDGIGKAIALELASRNLNLVLVGRNPSKLQTTKAQILTKYGKIEVKSIVIDLAKCRGEEIMTAIEDGIRGLDVGVVVNNAGVAYPYPKFFHEVERELMENVLRVNAEAPTWITRAVLPWMMEKKKGIIVNIGSASASVFPTFPLYTIYAASKAYISMFSRCINLEYKQFGIDIQCQIPVAVATNMTEAQDHVKKLSLFFTSPEKYAKWSVRWFGYEQLCSPLWSHHAQWAILDLLPPSLLSWTAFFLFLVVRRKSMAEEAEKLR